MYYCWYCVPATLADALIIAHPPTSCQSRMFGGLTICWRIRFEYSTPHISLLGMRTTVTLSDEHSYDYVRWMRY